MENTRRQGHCRVKRTAQPAACRCADSLYAAAFHRTEYGRNRPSAIPPCAGARRRNAKAVKLSSLTSMPRSATCFSALHGCDTAPDCRFQIRDVLLPMYRSGSSGLCRQPDPPTPLSDALRDVHAAHSYLYKLPIHDSCARRASRQLHVAAYDGYLTSIAAPAYDITEPARIDVAWGSWRSMGNGDGDLFLH
jgi:hypothetical protein